MKTEAGDLGAQLMGRLLHKSAKTRLAHNSNDVETRQAQARNMGKPEQILNLAKELVAGIRFDSLSIVYKLRKQTSQSVQERRTI